jgi:copper resistance protein B
LRIRIALPRALLALLCIAATPAPAQQHEHGAGAPAGGQSEHVPPDPPASELPPLEHHDLMRMMAMDDAALQGSLRVDELELRARDRGSGVGWDVQAWFGGDYHKLWLKTEGDARAGTVHDARTEVLWDRAASRWWNLQAGLRHDSGSGPARDWATLGVRGVAPFFIELDAAAYLGEQGRTAARLAAHQDWLLTQRLVLQPSLELDAYGKADPARSLGSGVAQLRVGLRLRYELRREFAPYAGVQWERSVGATAGLRRAAGEDAGEVYAVAGLRFWF